MLKIWAKFVVAPLKPGQEGALAAVASRQRRLCMIAYRSCTAGEETIQHVKPEQIRPAPLPRAKGGAVVGVQADEAGQTRLKQLRQSGSMKVIFPHTFRPDLQGVLVNTAGGMTGGDDFRVSADVGQGATLTLTTQAAERIYRAVADAPATVRAKLKVASGARLNWMPQETILFDQARLNRRLEIDLSGDAVLVCVETLVFGRAAMGERLNRIDLHDRISVRRDGKILVRDGIRLRGSGVDLLERAAIGQGAGVVSTILYVAPQAEALLPKLHALLPPLGGASLLCEGVIAMRLLAGDSFDLRAALIPILETLGEVPLPAVWRL